MAVQPEPRSDVPPGGDPAAARAGQQEQIAQRLAEVRSRVRDAAEGVGRSPHAVTLVAVSKTFPVEAVLAARTAGHADFGESKAQELRRKREAVGVGVRWHFVGRLQRNKVRDVVGVTSLIHSVGRLELAQTIAAVAVKRARVQRVLLQVNVGDDPAKGGCALEDVAGLLAQVRSLDGIACEGLMTIPPLDVDPRPLFGDLRAVRDEMRSRFPEVQHLSMGMSHDFETAVEEGATIVRVGEAIFGSRAPVSGVPG